MDQSHLGQSAKAPVGKGTVLSTAGIGGALRPLVGAGGASGRARKTGAVGKAGPRCDPDGKAGPRIGAEGLGNPMFCSDCCAAATQTPAISVNAMIWMRGFLFRYI